VLAAVFLVKIADLDFIFRDKFFEQGSCVVGRTVIDDDPLEVIKSLVAQTFVEFSNDIRAVIRWREDSNYRIHRLKKDREQVAETEQEIDAEKPENSSRDAEILVAPNSFFQERVKKDDGN